MLKTSFLPQKQETPESTRHTCCEIILSAPFTPVNLINKALTALFVLDYLFEGVCIANGLRRQRQCLALERTASVCIALRD